MSILSLRPQSRRKDAETKSMSLVESVARFLARRLSTRWFFLHKDKSISSPSTRIISCLGDERRPDADFRGTTETEGTTEIGLERDLEVVKAGFWHLVQQIMRGDAILAHSHLEVVFLYGEHVSLWKHHFLEFNLGLALGERLGWDAEAIGGSWREMNCGWSKTRPYHFEEC